MSHSMTDPSGRTCEHDIPWAFYCKQCSELPPPAVVTYTPQDLQALAQFVIDVLKKRRDDA